MIPEGQSGLALDIDDTLCHTHIHWVKELHALFGAPHDWEYIAAEHRWVEEYPHWSEHEGALRWMDEARNSNDIQEKFPLIENADRMVERIGAIIPVVAYLTARPERVRDGTHKWLRKHGFPDLPLIMRPDEIPNRGGGPWKAQLLHELYPQVRGIVDDRPSLIEHLPKGYKGTVFLYGEGREDAREDISVIECATWEDVYERVKEVFS